MDFHSLCDPGLVPSWFLVPWFPIGHLRIRAHRVIYVRTYKWFWRSTIHFHYLCSNSMTLELKYSNRCVNIWILASPSLCQQIQVKSQPRCRALSRVRGSGWTAWTWAQLHAHCGRFAHYLETESHGKHPGALLEWRFCFRAFPPAATFTGDAVLPHNPHFHTLFIGNSLSADPLSHRLRWTPCENRGSCLVSHYVFKAWKRIEYISIKYLLDEWMNEEYGA